MCDQKTAKGMSRRSFLTSAAAVGTGLAVSPGTLAQVAGQASDYVNVGLIGAGTQGQALLETCLKIPAVRIIAICDIWAEYNLRRASDMLNESRQAHGTYLDYRDMLDSESALDAVIVATPDFCHADQTVACLKAGLPVYCEAPMSNTADGARRMLRAAEETGKLLQVGHQRRSNPKYRHCGDTLLREVKLLGKLVALSAQWNRPVQPDRGWPRRAPLEEATLNKHGYESMQQFRNWQWYKNLGGGPLAALGSHQIDVFNWFAEALPRSVVASGGAEYYSKMGRECYDTVMAIYEYRTRRGTVRAFYQTVNSNSNMGSFETFMGDEGTMSMSEAGQCRVYREESAPEWRRWVRMGFLLEPKEKEKDESQAALEVTDTVEPPSYRLPIQFAEPNHKPHLENFFNAIRGKEELHCPARVAYETTITVLKVNDAVEAGRKLDFSRDDFTA
jgi:predicted dehydrogenase